MQAPDKNIVRAEYRTRILLQIHKLLEPDDLLTLNVLLLDGAKDMPTKAFRPLAKRHKHQSKIGKKTGPHDQAFP